jgi:hypothetical protein
VSDDAKNLTDTGRQRAVEDAAERGMRRYFEGNTPPMVQRHGDSSDTYEIAERVVDRKEPAHILFCENDPSGPACKVTKRLEQMETRMGLRMERIQNEAMDDRKEILRVQQVLDKFIGESEFKRRVLPLITGILGSSVAAALVMFLLRHLVIR